MQRFIKAFLVSSIFVQPLLASTIEINEISDGEIILSITVDSIKEKKIVQEGFAYDFIGIDEFGYKGELGFPQLPSRALSLITSENPHMSIEIISAEIDTLKNRTLYPTQAPQVAVSGEAIDYPFQRNEEAYERNRFYPSSPLECGSTVTVRGVPVSHLSVTPVQYNAVTKELLIYKKLKARVSFAMPALNRTNMLNKKSLSLLKNGTVNGTQLITAQRDLSAEYNDDILILTVPAFKAAADSLAVWQKMKGYDVKIDARESWTTTSIKEASHAFYNNTAPKPGYLIILGDHEHLPAINYDSDELGQLTTGHVSDNEYVCMGGKDDFVPEMARGRISVDTPEEAITVINKIIHYEKTPPAQSSYYNNALSCAYFQDHGEDNMTGYADRAFIQVVDRINNYLKDDHNITSERIYSTRNITNPTNYNNTRYSWGEPIPDYLKRGTFNWIDSPMPWDSDNGYERITAGINKGAFLVYHYDHGNVNGWGHPTFRNEHIPMLTNEGQLPIIYSIDCLVGMFEANECFAEKILRHPKGGTAGIVAASTLSWSGHNDALLQGMIDATWPSDKMILASPHMGKAEDITVTAHEPVYTMGDIVDQGKLRMIETWQNLPQGGRYHYQIYQYFGDPTTELWTAEPKEITYTSLEDEIAVTEKSVQISGLNISEGFATLYNPKTGNIVGKSPITGNKLNIPVNDETGAIGDTVLLTVRAHNYRPLIKEIMVTVQTGIIEVAKTTAYTFSDKGLTLQTPLKEAGSITITDMLGRAVQKITLPAGSHGVVFDTQKLTLASGVYVVTASINSESLVRKIQVQ